MRHLFSALLFGALFAGLTVHADSSQAPAVNLNVTSNVTVSQPTQTPAATATPAAPSTPMLHFNRPVFYTMALTQDPVTSSRIAVEAAHQLAVGVTGRRFDTLHYDLVSAPVTWALTDLINVCAYDPHATLGALLFYNTFGESMSASYLAATRSRFQLDSDVSLIECSDSGTLNVAWTVSDVAGADSSTSVNLLPITYIASAIKAVFPGKTSSTVMTTTTNVYPSPLPSPSSTPISSTVFSQTNNNPMPNTALTTLALSIGSQFTNIGAPLTVPGNNTDPVGRGAAARLVTNALRTFSNTFTPSPDSAQRDEPLKSQPGVTCSAYCKSWFPLTEATPPPPPSPSPSPSAPVLVMSPDWSSRPLASPSATDINAFLTLYANTTVPMAPPAAGSNPSIKTYESIAYALDATTTKGFMQLSKTTTYPRFDDFGGLQLCSELPGKVETLYVPIGDELTPVDHNSPILRFRAPNARLSIALVPPVCATSFAALDGAGAPSPHESGGAPSFFRLTKANDDFKIVFETHPDANRFAVLLERFYAAEGKLAAK